MIVETPRYFLIRRRVSLAWMASWSDAALNPRWRDEYINRLVDACIAMGPIEEN